MIVKRKLPGSLASSMIERQAGRISDPVARLRYLKRMVAARGGVPMIPRLWKIPAIAALSTLAVMIPRVQTGSDAKGKPITAIVDPDRQAVSLESKPRGKIWRVEFRRDQEVYSNGLRVENRFVVRNYPRLYRVYPRGQNDDPTLVSHTEPAGIVFHTTESMQAPFESEHNADLRRISENTLEHARSERSYHFIIDRFGRVFRIVQEADVAFHAGKSVWADDKYIYIGLNDSFLAVSFEARTRDISEGGYLSPAQILSGRLLIQMLVDKYRIPDSNCITHSQVSVNPVNKKIGNHTDGAGDFPFQQLGLPDNYSLPLPSVFMFGFDYDLLYMKSTGYRLWKGLFLADERIREECLAHQLPIPVYKATLRRKYRKIAEAVEIQNTPEEKER